MRKRRQLSCSFCGKKEKEVSKLVAGPKVYICDECVAVANRIMSGDFNGDFQSSKAEPSVWHRLFGLMRRLVRGGSDQHMNSVAAAS